MLKYVGCMRDKSGIWLCNIWSKFLRNFILINRGKNWYAIISWAHCLWLPTHGFIALNHRRLPRRTRLRHLNLILKLQFLQLLALVRKIQRWSQIEKGNTGVILFHSCNRFWFFDLGIIWLPLGFRTPNFIQLKRLYIFRPIFESCNVRWGYLLIHAHIISQSFNISYHFPLIKFINIFIFFLLLFLFTLFHFQFDFLFFCRFLNLLTRFYLVLFTGAVINQFNLYNVDILILNKWLLTTFLNTCLILNIWIDRKLPLPSLALPQVFHNRTI